MSEKPVCSEKVSDPYRFGGRQCEQKAKYQVNGIWFCGIHNPEAVKARDLKMRSKWDADSKAWTERRAREVYDAKAGNACRDLGIVDPETELPKLVRREEV